MKNPFDMIVGPDGVWKDDVVNDAEVVNENNLTPRENFAIRCLNTAVNLYGILTMDEFVYIYNVYAKGHEPDISKPMTVEELGPLVDNLLKVCGVDFTDFALFDSTRTVCYFGVWVYKNTGKKLIVGSSYLPSFPDGTAMSQEECSEKYRREVNEKISQDTARILKVDLKILPEDEFFAYEDFNYNCEADKINKVADFVVEEYGIDCDTASSDIDEMASWLKSDEATLRCALDFIFNICDWQPKCAEEMYRLVGALHPIVYNVRNWQYRGHSRQEMCELGVLKDCKEDLTEFYNKISENDVDDDVFFADDLPEPEYAGPIDFKLVKDATWREAKMETYFNVRQVLDEFAIKFLNPKFYTKRLSDAEVLLECIKPGDPVDSCDEADFYLATDYITYFDVADGGPTVLLQKDRIKEMNQFERLAWKYFSKARFSWFAIEAIKAGFGMKCRDLLTGEEAFVMDKSLSTHCEFKGQTMMIGVMPMGDVYITCGSGNILRIDDPAARLETVLSRIGVLNLRPIQLSRSEQARFFIETFRSMPCKRQFVK